MLKNSAIVTISPEIMGGTLVFAGTRVPVQKLLDYLKAGESINKFLESFPTVTREQIIALLEEAEKQIVATEQEYKKRPLTEELRSGIKLELVEIPAGILKMGSKESSNQQPIHEVNLKSFLMGKYPITNEQWKALMGTDLSASSGSKFTGPKQPVINVSWEDAKQFCEKLSQRSDKKFQLPSEAQWEYACRAGSTTKYYFGDSDSHLENYGWFSENSNSQTHIVGKKQPNNWDLYDMHGNVWEWCEDVWHRDYNGAPKDGTPWLNDGTSSNRLLRGGSWYSYCACCRCAMRYSHTALNRSYDYGFRVVVC